MLTAELPRYLQEEFERSARLVYDRDGVRQALVEAVELWLARHSQSLADAERAANDRAFEELRERLEREYGGKWVAIAYGQLQGVGDSLEEVDQFAPTARERIIVRIGEDRPKEVELGWQMAFA